MAGFFGLIVSSLYGDLRPRTDRNAKLGWSSTRVVAMFFTAFGAAGAIARSDGVNAQWSILIGVFAGHAAGFAALLLVRFFQRREASLLPAKETEGRAQDDPS